MYLFRFESKDAAGMALSDVHNLVVAVSETLDYYRSDNIQLPPELILSDSLPSAAKSLNRSIAWFTPDRDSSAGTDNLLSIFGYL
jgi:hypothetical protein